MIFVEGEVLHPNGRSSSFTAVLRRSPPMSHIEIERALLRYARDYPQSFAGQVEGFRILAIVENGGDILVLPHKQEGRCDF